MATVYIKRDFATLVSRLTKEERDNVIQILLCLNRLNVTFYKDLWSNILDYLVTINGLDIVKFVDNYINNNKVVVGLGYKCFIKDITKCPIEYFTNGFKQIGFEIDEISNYSIGTNRSEWCYYIHQLNDIIFGIIIPKKPTIEIEHITINCMNNILSCSKKIIIQLENSELTYECYLIEFPLINQVFFNTVNTYIKFNKPVSKNDFTINIAGCYLHPDTHCNLKCNALGEDTYKGYCTKNHFYNKVKT